MLNGEAGENELNYGLVTGSGQWATEFSYGTVWGMANCNYTSGTANTAGTPTLASSGIQCWCKVIGFTASGNGYALGPRCTTSLSNLWVFYGNTGYGTEADCAQNCAYRCANTGFENAEFRTAAFGAVGQ